MLLARPSHRIIFASALFLLVVCGVASGWTLYRIYSGEKWVRHSYDVQLLVGGIESGLGKTGRSRQHFLQVQDQRYVAEIANTRGEVFDEIGQLRRLTRDNSDQARNVAELEQAARTRFEILDRSINLINSGKSTDQAQDKLTAELVDSSQQAATVAQSMMDGESRLLDRRLVLTDSRFIAVIQIFAVTFLLSLYTLWEHYRGLNRELAQRKLAEQNALELGSQLLNAQDQERRKFARDLHDGLGQNLAAAKMIADSFLSRPPDKQKVLDLSAILDDAVSSTRSISHLLHPPLVEEMGFLTAARSYLDGFSSRTGIRISIDLPENEDRLPRDLELTMFRVLQEALINIQRHSKSAKAEVRFRANASTAALQVRDFGIGLPPQMIQDFNENGSSVGVGLAGMKERVRERNGQFQIHSDSAGTIISATLPVVPDPAATV